MNWEQVKRNVTAVGRRVQEKWAEMTDEDLSLLEGKCDVFLRRLQQRTGLSEAETNRSFDNFMEDFDIAELETPPAPEGR
ncbi:MAG: CsbD family protein [Archangium sp.]